jgi:hypothetical protein
VTGHSFAVLAVETFDDGRDKKMVEWCKGCGLARITTAPKWKPTYLVVGDHDCLQGGSRWGRRTPPTCKMSPTSGESP